MPWPFLAALAAIGEAAGTAAAGAGSAAGSTLAGVGAGAAAGAAGAGAGAATAAGSTLAGVGAGAAMGAAGAGLGAGLMGAAGGAGAGLINGLGRAPGLMGGSMNSSVPTGGMSGLSQPSFSTTQMAPQLAQSVPSKMDMLTKGITTPTSTAKPGLFSGLYDKYGDQAMKMMQQGMQGGGGEQRGPAQMPPPGLMRGLMTPFTPMAFSPSNYQFRRGPGY